MRLRRGSIGGADLEGSSTRASFREETGVRPRQNARASLQRRGSTGGIAPPRTEAPAGAAPEEAEPDPGELGQEQNECEKEDNMPSASKKKRNSSGPSRGASGGDQDGEGVDPALLKFLTTMKEDLMQTTRDAVGSIETKLERHEVAIANVERRIERGERELAGRISTEVAKQVALTTRTTTSAPPSKNQETKREAAYHLCRRSLKLWPVDGDDLPDAVRNFISNKLGFADARIRLLGTIEASALPGKASRDRKEVLATFETREDRDAVKAGGINLAGQKDVGMSLHVPGHLMDNLVALNGLAYSIKSRNPDTKRSVKFDDSNMGLYLDICIAGKWRRIGPEEAKQALKAVPLEDTSRMAMSVEELTGLMKGDKDGRSESSAIVVPDDSMEA